MRKFALKAVFSILPLSKMAGRTRDWSRIALVFSTAVTIGLVALYAYEKAGWRG